MRDQRRPDDPWHLRLMWHPLALPAAFVGSLLLGLIILLVFHAFGGSVWWMGAEASGGGNTPVAVCHQTGSESNPWVAIVVDDDSLLPGHLGHGDFLITTPMPCPPVREEEEEEPEPPVDPPTLLATVCHFFPLNKIWATIAVPLDHVALHLAHGDSQQGCPPPADPPVEPPTDDPDEPELPPPPDEPDDPPPPDDPQDPEEPEEPEEPTEPVDPPVVPERLPDTGSGGLAAE